MTDARASKAPLLLAVLLTWGCTGSRSSEESPRPKPPEQTTVFLSPAGDDAAAGTKEAPRRTFARALAIGSAQKIVLAAGRYAEEEVTLDRPIEVTATGTATLEGRLVIRGSQVRLRGLGAARGMSIEDASGVEVDEAVVSSGGAVDSLVVQRSEVRLVDLELDCGAETCLRVTGSTVAIESLKLEGSTKRGILVETASVAIDGLTARGTSVAQVQAGRGGWVGLTRAELTGAGASAIACTGGGLRTGQVKIRDAKNTGVLLSGCDAWLEGLDLAGLEKDAVGIGIEGSTVRIDDATIVSRGRSAVVINNHRDRPAEVTIEGGKIDHGARNGINLGQGRLTIRGLVMSGDSKAKTDGEDAILCSGQLAELRAESVKIDAAAGFGIGLYNDAFGSISGEITRPRLGGVTIDRAAGAEVLLQRLVISGCKLGSGIVAQDALDVRIEKTQVSGCAEAGVLAGEKSHLSVIDSRFEGNRLYGIAAFGGTEIEVRGSIAKKSRWATFATCADGARIIDQGGNGFVGPATTCP